MMAKLGNLEPVIRKGWRGDGYAFERLPARVLAALEEGKDHRGNFGGLSAGRLGKVLECFLQITDQKFPEDGLPDSSVHFLKAFVGAAWSPAFIEQTSMGRYVMSRSILVAAPTLFSSTAADTFTSCFEVGIEDPTPFVKECLSLFESLHCDEEKVWQWRGWSAQNSSGRLTWFPFVPVYKRLGRGFVEKLHYAAELYYRARRSQRVPCLSELCGFVGDAKASSLDGLKDPESAIQFWDDFFKYYITLGVASSDVSTLIRNWRNEFVTFAEEHLFNDDLFVRPQSGLPMPPSNLGRSGQAHVRIRGGNEVTAKLLTPVPLEATEEEAMELLFKQIENDVGLVERWAEECTSDLDHKIRERRRLARTGQIRTIGISHICNGQRWLVDPANPDRLANACATFEHHGYQTSKDTWLGVQYPLPLPQTADSLGLPSGEDLIAHAALLVIDHPTITPAFLESLEVFDKNGNRSGFVRMDGGYYLDGRKLRRGVEDAEQLVQLTLRGVRTVARILRATEPLRRYLRLRGDDSWRHLLLTAGRAFSYPIPIRRLATFTSAKNCRQALEDSIARVWNADREEISDFVLRLSLPTLRASCGVLQYIKDGNAEKMAEVLGHKRYDPRLLEMYLPPVILSWFQERWIRIFQQGLLVQAMGNSEFLFEASGFESIEQLSAFLRAHALVDLSALDKSQKRVRDASEGERKVLISVDEAILTSLLSLETAVAENPPEDVRGTAKFWAGLTKVTTCAIRSSDRDDLKQMLQAAERQVDPRPYREVILA